MQTPRVRHAQTPAPAAGPLHMPVFTRGALLCGNCAACKPPSLLALRKPGLRFRNA
jgi:hypothetical protein